MTAPTTTVRPAVTEPSARFRDLLAAEWAKLWSLRSTHWTLLLSGLVIIGININAAVADHHNWPHYDAGIRAIFVPIWAMRDAFTLISGMIIMLVAGSIGAITITGEYGTGLIRTTFAAVPARRSLVAAKLIDVTVVMLGYGTVVAGVSFWATQAILSGHHVGMSIGYPGAFQAVAASALLAPVCALLGMGLGAIIRHGAATMAITTAVLLLLPPCFTDHYRWTADIKHAMPSTAWQRLVDVGYGRFGFTVRHPTTTTEAWITLAIWAVAAAAVAVTVVDRRDV
ncbi:ABC transporter permease [Actinoallomurus spadix]|uniref:ABC transporter permease n=1 Tax=Actinoallomurus spadix TaxID=79912 RepID=A0ABN0XQU4_9ACTN|nr:ABC transporter permease [Actinoallomurus spadix]MCO5988280.1 ABC transporter permease [Actinoallomurus spadix]